MSTVIPIKIHPRATRGRFSSWRLAFIATTQLLFFGLPWLNWHGRQAVWFDFVGSRFHLFGLTLWPHDFIYVAALLILCALGLFWWTALAGRLWCGFSCPQTVYTALMVGIERLFQGERAARLKLDAAPWSPAKLLKKGATHASMLALSLAIGFSFVGWFVPIRALARGDWSGWQWFWVLFYAGFTYLLAGRLRENVCKHMCPYARFQGVMFDPDTRSVSYDTARGEPRGKHGGGCVDCTLCVQVCPTGIDIRHGLQYECINCGVCIDACDTVMDKIGAPRGLIRFASANALAGRPAKRMWQRPRLLVYAALLLAVVLACAAGLALRQPLRLEVARDRAFLVREADNGWLENGYSVQLLNTSGEPLRVRLEVQGLPLLRLENPPTLQLAPGARASVQLRVQALPDYATRGSHAIEFVARSLDQPRTLSRERSSFIGE